MVSTGLSRLFALAGLLAACGGRKTGADFGGDTPQNQALMRKADGYVTCHETFSQVVFRLESLYRERFAAAAPASGAEVVLPALPDLKECLEDAADAKGLMPAAPELDAAGQAYVAALTTIHRLVTSYDRSQAARIHPELLAAFDAFDRAQPLLFDQLYTINRTVHLAQYAKRAASEDRSVALLVEEAQLRAEDLVRFAATPPTELDKLDLDGLARSLAQYERSLLALEDLERNKPEEAKAFFNFDNLLVDANKLAMAARQLAHRAADKVAYSDAEKLMLSAGNDADVVGTPAALAQHYNRVAGYR